MSEYCTYEQLVATVIEQSPRDVVQRYILDLFPYCFKDSPELYWELREMVCFRLGIHPQNFAIAGSGKLGFSIAPKKLGKPFDDGSDLDVILVSQRLFYEIWDKLVTFRDRPDYRLQSSEKRKACHTLKYTLFFGHVMLEVLTQNFDFAKDWWKFFNKLSVDDRFGPRQINAAVFRDWLYVDRFYERSIRAIKSKHKEVIR